MTDRPEKAHDKSEAAVFIEAMNYGNHIALMTYKKYIMSPQTLTHK